MKENDAYTHRKLQKDSLSLFHITLIKKNIVGISFVWYVCLYSIYAHFNYF